MDDTNPLLGAPPSNPLAITPPSASAPSLADAWQYNAQAVANYVQQQRQQSYDQGLADPATGLPTPQGVRNAAGAVALGISDGGSPGSVFQVPKATHMWDYFPSGVAPYGAALGKVVRTDNFTPTLKTVHYRIPDDYRAAVQYEYDPMNPGGHATVTDVFRGDQPFGTSGQMLADAFAAQGVQPKSVSIDNIIHQPTLQAVGQGVPLELTTLGRTLTNAGQHLGASAEGFQWIRGNPLDKPTLMVRMNYDRPQQGPVPVAWTGRTGYADANAALMGQRVMQVRRLDHFDPYLDRQNPGSTWLNPDEQPTRWVPEEQLRPINYDRSGSPY